MISMYWRKVSAQKEVEASEMNGGFIWARFVLLLCAISIAWGVPALRSSAKDYFVNPTGANNAFTSIQAAINAVPSGTASNRTNIFIAPGIYTETAGSNSNLNIAKPYVSLIGQGSAPGDVVIQNAVGGLTGATRLQSSASDFMAKNLTFKSSVGDNNGVGVALRNSADRSAFTKVHFIGYQDTLLAENGARQYYRDCYITGDTDFIFGSATAVFDRSVINSTSGGYVTAANTSRQQAIGLVFLNSTLTATGTPGAGPRSVALGRPWQWPDSNGGSRASVTFINTKMGTHISTGGWDPWNGAGGIAVNPDPDGTTRYSEFNSMNLNGTPLSLGSTGLPANRVGWADPMTSTQAAAYTLENIFSGPAFWNSHPELQPDFIGPYTQQSGVAPWNPLNSLAALPQVPEPSSATLLFSALVGFGLLRRRSENGIHCLKRDQSLTIGRFVCSLIRRLRSEQRFLFSLRMEHPFFAEKGR